MADDGLCGGIGIGKRHVAEADAAGGVELNGRALLFEGVLLEFHEALGGGEDADEGGHELGERAGRTLYLVDELQEGGHAAEGERACRHADGAPQEGGEVAHGKTEIEQQMGEHGEGGAAHHTMAQLALGVFQTVDHRVVALHGLDEHAVLDGFLEHALHLRVAVAYLTGEGAHLTHIETAQRHKQGDDGHGDQCERGVHEEEVDEGTDEEGEHREGAGKGLGEEGDDIGDVELQAVEHIAAMARLLAVPLGAQDAVEHALLHAILGADAQDVLHPHSGNAQSEIEQDEQGHDAYRPIERPADNMGGYIDGMLDGPHLHQTDSHAQQSKDGIEDGLQAVAPPRPPQPTENGAGRIFAFFDME